MRIKNLILLLILMILTGRIYSQDEVLPLEKNSVITVGASFQMWKNSGFFYPFNQLSFPVSMMLPLSETFNLNISHTPALSWRYGEYRVLGLSDTWIQGTTLLWNEKLMFNVGLGIPTGKTRLDSAEFVLIQDISKDIYKFRLPVYGQGFCGKAGVAFAFEISEALVVGFGGQYVYRGAYHPVSYEYGSEVGITEPWDVEYNPGDEASGHLGLDFRIGTNLKIMLDGIYTYYWADKQDSVSFGAGPKVAVNLGFFYRFDHRFVWGRFIYRQKEKNELNFIEELRNSNGPQLEFDGLMKLGDFTGGELFLVLESRYFGRNENDEEERFVFGGGFSSLVELTDLMSLDIRFKYLVGNFIAPYKRKLGGLETYVGLRFEL